MLGARISARAIPRNEYRKSVHSDANQCLINGSANTSDSRGPAEISFHGFFMLFGVVRTTICTIKRGRAAPGRDFMAERNLKYSMRHASPTLRLLRTRVTGVREVTGVAGERCYIRKRRVIVIRACDRVY